MPELDSSDVANPKLIRLLVLAIDSCLQIFPQLP